MQKPPPIEPSHLNLNYNQRVRLDSIGSRLELFLATELGLRERDMRAGTEADLKKAAALTDKYWTQNVAIAEAVEALQAAGEWTCPGVSPEQTKKLWQSVKDAIDNHAVVLP